MDKPSIRLGMTVGDVLRSVGDPSEVMTESQVNISGSEFASEIKRFEQEKAEEKEYWLFDHPAGKYKVIFHRGVVVDIIDQP